MIQKPECERYFKLETFFSQRRKSFFLFGTSATHLGDILAFGAIFPAQNNYFQ